MMLKIFAIFVYSFVFLVSTQTSKYSSHDLEKIKEEIFSKVQLTKASCYIFEWKPKENEVTFANSMIQRFAKFTNDRNGLIEFARNYVPMQLNVELTHKFDQIYVPCIKSFWESYDISKETCEIRVRSSFSQSLFERLKNKCAHNEKNPLIPAFLKCEFDSDIKINDDPNQGALGRKLETNLRLAVKTKTIQIVESFQRDSSGNILLTDTKGVVSQVQNHQTILALIQNSPHRTDDEYQIDCFVELIIDLLRQGKEPQDYPQDIEQQNEQEIAKEIDNNGHDVPQPRRKRPQPEIPIYSTILFILAPIFLQIGVFYIGLYLFRR